MLDASRFLTFCVLPKHLFSLLEDSRIYNKAAHNLINWVRGSGGIAHNVYLHGEENGAHALHVRNGVDKDALLLGIPGRCIISEQLIDRSLRSQADFSSVHSLFAEFLLQETVTHSFWRPYIEGLPKRYDHIPVTHEEGHPILGLLKGSHALELQKERRLALLGDYERYAEHTTLPWVAPLEQFIWARMAVTSRIFRFYVDGTSTRGLVPLADMCNHAVNPSARWGYCDASNQFQLCALYPLDPGDEITISYGSKCNSRLYNSYGFILEDNPANLASIRLPLAGEKIHWETPFREDSRPRHYRISRRFNKTHAALLSVLRLSSMTPQEGPGAGMLPVAELPISIANERLALLQLVRLTKRALDGFDTSISEDRLVLDGKGLSPAFRNAISVRMHEKEVLHFTRRCAMFCVRLLQMDGEVLKRKVAQGLISNSEQSAWEKYIEDCILPLRYSQ